MANNVLNEHFSEPLNGVTTALVSIDAGDGNLMVGQLTDSEQLLAAGILQYLEQQGLPTRSLVSSNGQAELTLKGGVTRQRWFHLPWAACNGATEWQVNLNPKISSDITAHSNGGNLSLNLAGMSVIRLAADTGGGNVDIDLPDLAADLNVTAQTGAGNVAIEIGSGTSGSSMLTASSGAGNVSVRIPYSLAARIRAGTGLGKVMMDSRFIELDSSTFQSSGFDHAVNKVELVLHSGAGNVIVTVI